MANRQDRNWTVPENHTVEPSLPKLGRAIKMSLATLKYLSSEGVIERAPDGYDTRLVCDLLERRYRTIHKLKALLPPEVEDHMNRLKAERFDLWIAKAVDRAKVLSALRGVSMRISHELASMSDAAQIEATLNAEFRTVIARIKSKD